MRNRLLLTVTGLALALAACSPTPQAAQPAEPPLGAATGTPSPTSGGPPPTGPQATPTQPDNKEQENDVTGTIVHFTTGSTVVEVTITEDTATTRDFLSMLPMTQTFEDFNGMEKITYPPRGFDTSDNEGMKPKVGDLFSYIPWSNLGFFYKTGSLGFSNQLVRIGTTEDIDAVLKLDGQEVVISIAG